MNLKIETLAILIGLLSLNQLPSTKGQSLSAEYLDVTLPVADASMAPYFDGHDSIYLPGGRRPETLTNTLKF